MFKISQISNHYEKIGIDSKIYGEITSDKR